MNSNWRATEASNPVTGIKADESVLVVVSRGLLPWLRESCRGEIQYWRYEDGKLAQRKLAEYQALLKNLEGK